MTFNPAEPLGIHENISDELYNESAGARRSLIMRLQDGRPLDVRHYLAHGIPDSPALRIGTAVDVAITTPDEYENRVLQTDLASTRSKAWTEAQAANPTKTCLTIPESYTASGCIYAISHSPRAQEVLDGTLRQLSVWWEHTTLTGAKLLCKARPDAAIEEHGRTIDVKTCGNFSDVKFARSVWDYGYDVQGYMNAEGFKAHGWDWKEHVLICARKYEPFDVRVFVWTLEGPWMELGQNRFQALAHRYEQMVSQDQKHGYADEVNHLPMPKWIHDEGLALDGTNQKIAQGKL